MAPSADRQADRFATRRGWLRPGLTLAVGLSAAVHLAPALLGLLRGAGAKLPSSAVAPVASTRMVVTAVPSRPPSSGRAVVGSPEATSTLEIPPARPVFSDSSAPIPPSRPAARAESIAAPDATRVTDGMRERPPRAAAPASASEPGTTAAAPSAAGAMPERRSLPLPASSATAAVLSPSASGATATAVPPLPLGTGETPTTAEAAASYRAGAGLNPPPRPLGNIDPAVPEAAGKRGGSVVLRLFINEKGTVDRAEVVSSTPPGLFDASALDAFGRALFSPGFFAGIAVKSQVVYEVKYRAVDSGAEASGRTY